MCFELLYRNELSCESISSMYVSSLKIEVILCEEHLQMMQFLIYICQDLSNDLKPQ